MRQFPAQWGWLIHLSGSIIEPSPVKLPMLLGDTALIVVDKNSLDVVPIRWPFQAFAQFSSYHPCGGNTQMESHFVRVLN
jgi:hypothetical protein